MRWGKGYAWNPVGFVERPKDPNDPELAREGYWMASADYIVNFTGPLTGCHSPVHRQRRSGHDPHRECGLLEAETTCRTPEAVVFRGAA